MKTVTEVIYRCDFCNKAMFNKGAMALHERMCKDNPKNRHKCFQYCKHLYRERNSDDGEFYFTCENSGCEMYEKDLHSYKLERNKEGKKRIVENHLTRMPIECEHYEIESGHDSYNER